jgi:hypothetical protein
VIFWDPVVAKVVVDPVIPRTAVNEPETANVTDEPVILTPEISLILVREPETDWV